ncbi:branched-chain amino acid transport system II carrier protein [Jeotgalibacillus sp. R-1-5s-1]|uniref:branched-chain amino acid transport system II carrier protein n=1 Tax=Jeotgalibacillus sp. R-1-5s-1 TaxID=2555897 RepID=UPI00106D6112|nr:branched-chain amino acid transport system II carrier protein [Jeotgalibacillus sp. R-1-5s-1]TFD98212.1 branched-chain amino acid transport system II carrier protein [Jeotgalibacillus sp. R-1-5s-1]
MTGSKITFGSVLTIGLMLFALFLGAGNMIFPPLLGQQAGDQSWVAIAGFLITGVGLPLLGVIAIAKSGGSPQILASRVHPIFGIIFTITLYLAIGPFFGIPRTATVSYEIGILPFLPESMGGGWTLMLSSFVFFAITAYLALNPTKLVDRIGKYLTPALVVILTVLVAGAFFTPMGERGEAVAAYESSPFFAGFLEGYLTLDAIAALVFALVVISAVKDRGITDQRLVVRVTILAGVIAATGLALVYIALSHLGATSIGAIGTQDNGGAILSASAAYLYGSSGAVILGLAITAACLTTSIGLVASVSTYFSKIVPNIPYKGFVFIFSGFSMIVANIGLTQLIAVSVPVLVMIYPVAIVLMVLAFLHNIINGYRAVYIGAIIPTGIIGIADGLAAAGFAGNPLSSMLAFLPLMEQTVGWMIPAVIGGIIGYLIAVSFSHTKRTAASLKST